ncbi:MAG: glycosyltransferase [Muribaculaceae bacterium]|nr:glycosyltransferase [Muribaculaceae bacterium]
MGQKRRVTFISRSDLRGGAAIVTYRLVEALRAEGVDARMLVCEKMSDSEFVDVCSSRLLIQYYFLKERLYVWLRNGRNRKTLFKIDPALDGLPICNHPWVKEADAIVLGWVNQGMLSLKGVRKLSSLGKPMVWIMHDMWNMTGVCHHAGKCSGFLHECGDCPLLGGKAHIDDMSHTTWAYKKRLYENVPLRFVAVSTWLAEKARESSLMRNLDITVIPNPFSIDMEETPERDETDGTSGIAFGAARLDDPIKGLPVLKKALKIIRDTQPEKASRMRLVTFGNVKDPAALDGIAIKHQHLGVLQGQESIKKAYRDCDIVVSTSDFETLPGTLIEGQAYGCIPVALSHGGQKDIIDHLHTGWLANWNDSESLRAENIAEGILWAFDHRDDTDMKTRMRESVKEKFDAAEVARRMMDFICPETPAE